MANSIGNKFEAFFLSLVTVLLVVDFALGVTSTSLTVNSSGGIRLSTNLELRTEGKYIKDANNNTVYLCGVNRPSGFTATTSGNFFNDGDWVWGSGVTTWNEAWVRTRLLQMRSAGFTTVRYVFYVDWWISNSRRTLGGSMGTPNIGMKDAMRETTRIMNELGMYAIWVPMGTEGQPSGSPIYPSGTSNYVAFMTNLVADLGQYPNAIFDLWSEPWGAYSWSSWAPIAQAAIAGIRTVSKNLIIVDFGSYFDFVTDSRVQGTNIVYSMHIYPYPYGAHLNGYYGNWITYNDIKNGLLNTWLCSVPINNNKPVIIGECGPWPDYGSSEVTRWTNTLQVFNDWGWSYCAWCWDQDQGWRLQDFGSNAPYQLSQYGTILSNAIPPSAGPVPTDYWSLTISSNPTAGGSTSPTGTVQTSTGSSRTVVATPAAGYKFMNWRLDGVNGTTSLSIIVPAQAKDSTHTLIAYFNKVSMGSPQDFTTFLESDSGSNIAITSTRCTVTNLRRDAASYVMKNLGADYFGDFTHYITTYVSAASNYANGAFWALSTNSVTEEEMSANAEGLKAYFYYDSAQGLQLCITDFATGIETTTTVSLNTAYYCILQRSGTTLTCAIYTDSARTNLFTALSMTCTTTRYRYLFTVMSRQSSEDNPAATISYYSENLILP